MERPFVKSEVVDGVESRNLSEPKHKSPTSFILIVLVVVAFIGLIVFGALPRIQQREQLVNRSQTQTAQALAVSVVIAQPGSAVEEFTLPGATQPIQDAPIYARVNGYLNKRYANIGDLVHQGQILADIDTPELDQQVQAAASSLEQAGAALDNSKEALLKSQQDVKTADANVRKAKSDLTFSTTEVARYNGLSQQGAVSFEDRDSHVQAYQGAKATLDALEAAERSAIASVNSARAAVHVSEAARNAARAQLQQYEATRSFKKVVAPFDGIVTKRNVDAGALITSGSGSSNALLFEVAKTDVLRVLVYVPEQYVTYIKEGEQAILNFQEYPRTDFSSTVTNVSGGVDPDSKTLQVEIHVPNADHKLLPGMYAKVRFESPSQFRLPVVPATTVQTRSDGAFIYTVDSSKHVHMHKLEIGRDLGGQFEVMKGISSGDSVIVSPPDDLRDGMLVDPVLVPAAKSDKSGK